MNISGSIYILTLLMSLIEEFRCLSLHHKDEKRELELELNKDVDQRAGKLLATFGLLADVQYADADDGFNFAKTKKRYYRDALNVKVKQAVVKWRAINSLAESEEEKVKFVIQLGDLLDGLARKSNEGAEQAMKRVLSELEAVGENIDVYHIWGNHDLYNFERKVLATTPLNTASKLNQNSDGLSNYYTVDVVENRLRLICLDFYEVSLLGYKEDMNEPNFKKAYELFKAHNKNDDWNSARGLRHNMKHWVAMNGALGEAQLKWLEEQLEWCKTNNVKAIVCGHVPLDKAWNGNEVQRLLWQYGNEVVLAYFCGHIHSGNFHVDAKNIPHITFDAILEQDENANSYALVKFYENKLVVDSASEKIGYHEFYFK